MTSEQSRLGCLLLLPFQEPFDPPGGNVDVVLADLEPDRLPAVS